MKLHIESTDQVVTMEQGRTVLHGPYTAPGRVWVGKTESGIPVQVLIVRVAVESKQRQDEFERELLAAHAPPPESRAFPLRFVL